MITLLSFLVIVLLIAAAAILFIRDVLQAVILLTVVSLLVSILFLFVAAPDVAITEAAIGSALTTIVFVVAYRRTRGGGRTRGGTNRGTAMQPGDRNISAQEGGE
ncbi:MAG: DUF4040 domain-containing protein [Spirochaetales bacterium]|nr:DUF4040 domain-containing protein [Spirochaetales bacterium]MCF7939446.1 DUF4040 domain-containing protein [Spirochaetales bacterium]